MNLRIILISGILFLSASLVFAQDAEQNCCQHSEQAEISKWGGYWKKRPRLTIHPKFLYGDTLRVEARIKIDVDETGKVVATEVLKSTGDPIQDKRFVDAIYKASFAPYYENGVQTAITVVQDFVIDTPIKIYE